MVKIALGFSAKNRQTVSTYIQVPPDYYCLSTKGNNVSESKRKGGVGRQVKSDQGTSSHELSQQGSVARDKSR
jgi:hypothetical protein